MGSNRTSRIAAEISLHQRRAGAEQAEGSIWFRNAVQRFFPESLTKIVKVCRVREIVADPEPREDSHERRHAGSASIEYPSRSQRAKQTREIPLRVRHMFYNRAREYEIETTSLYSCKR